MQETAQREERYTVQRPVYETQEREEWYTVARPVTQTVYRTEAYTVMQPVTTCATQFVDQGSYANQMVLKPSLFQTRLAWQSATTGIDPVTGLAVYQRPGFYWTNTPSGRYEVQQVWQPNVVAQQIPQTTYVPQTVQRQIPVETTTYQQEQVLPQGSGPGLPHGH